MKNSPYSKVRYKDSFSKMTYVVVREHNPEAKPNFDGSGGKYEDHLFNNPK